MSARDKAAEVLAAHLPTYTEHANDPTTTFYCHSCSEAVGEWVTWTPEHVADALDEAGLLADDLVEAGWPIVNPTHLADLEARAEKAEDQALENGKEICRQRNRAEKAERERGTAFTSRDNAEQENDRLRTERDEAREALARVEALADDWEADKGILSPDSIYTHGVMTRELRAALRGGDA